MKRLIDFLVSLFAVIALSPLLAALAIVIMIGSPGPVFYRGVRAGRFGRPFRIIKFRSMITDAEKAGGPSTSEGDPRVTAVGSWMRRYKLDELPQFFNVLVGDMSLVGPRPEVLSEVAEYDAEQRRVLTLRPGITDWASIWNADEGAVLAGQADPHRFYKKHIQPTKLRLQLKYLEEQSVASDIRILFYTIAKIIFKHWVPRELDGFGTPTGGKNDASRAIR